MNKHELFDLIGEANEDYVNAADVPAKRARPRWRTWAACAACAALVLGAYPAYRALTPWRRATAEDRTMIKALSKRLEGMYRARAPLKRLPRPTPTPTHPAAAAQTPR